MVYTVTFNPAIDYVVRVPEVELGATNRSSGEQIFFGGKGINVSAVLGELGVPSRALGFTAGFTGEAVEQGVRDMGVDADFVRLPAGNTRINVKIKSSEETEINCQGPDIPESAVNELFGKLDRLSSGDTLVLAGSIPKSLPSDIYERILERLSDRKIRAVVVLKFKPFLIKPNGDELGELFGVKINTEDELVTYAEKLREMGAQNVLVSLAGDGALLIDERGERHRQGVCRGKVVNSVGAGDSMVAGFIAGSTGGDYAYALKLGTAAGGATAFSEGLAKRELIDQLLSTL